MCIGFVWHGFASEGDTVMIFLQLHPCVTEPVSTSASMDLGAMVAAPLGKQNPEGGKETGQQQVQPERRVRICETHSPAEALASEEGGGGGARDAGMEIPLKPVVQTDRGEGTVPLELVEISIGVEETPCQSRWIPKGDCEHREACAGVGSWQPLRPCEDPHWSILLLKHPLWSKSWRTAAHVEDSHQKNSWRDSRLKQGKSVRNPSLGRKEWQRQCEMNWMQPPFPTPLSCWRGGGRENQEISCTQEEGWVWEEVVFEIWFSHFPYLIWLVIN